MRADNNHVPTYTYLESRYSDYFFQCLTGGDDPDPYPDIAIGRWCVETPGDLENIVDKTLAFQSPNPNPDWNCAEALLVAHKQNHIDEGLWAPRTKDYINAAYFNNQALLQYGHAGGDNDGVSDAIELDGGVGIVNYLGHGSHYCWDDWTMSSPSSFRTEHVHELTQDPSVNGYPLVYNVACGCGRFVDPAGESIVEAWTRDPNGGGVGAFGSTQSGGTVGKSANAIDSMIFVAHFDDILNCGMGINDAKIEMIYVWNELNMAKTYTWIGDPDLDIWREGPDEAYVVAPDTIYQGQEYVDIYVYRLSDDAPVPWAAGCLLYVGPDTGYFYQRVERTNEAGFTRIDLPVELVAGDYLLTVTAQTEPISIVPIQDSIYGSSGFFASDVEEDPQVIDWNLEPVHPNVLRSHATISYSVAGRLGSNGTQSVKLSVFDVSGREVKVLASDRHVPGHYEVFWDGRDNEGLRCASGVYFVRMRSHEFDANQRVVLLK